MGTRVVMPSSPGERTEEDTAPLPPAGTTPATYFGAPIERTASLVSPAVLGRAAHPVVTRTPTPLLPPPSSPPGELPPLPSPSPYPSPPLPSTTPVSGIPAAVLPESVPRPPPVSIPMPRATPTVPLVMPPAPAPRAPQSTQPERGQVLPPAPLSAPQSAPHAPPVAQAQQAPPGRPFRPTLGSAVMPNVTSRTHRMMPAVRPQAGPPTQVRFPAPGDVLSSARGGYHVTRALGKGAYGAVYEAIGPFDQRYALKLIVPANRPYAEVQAEWARESQRLLVLRHPNVVYMHDAFEHDFLFYMALEWCSYSLRDLLQASIAPELAIELTRQMLAAIQYLHDNDIVHGDLHPGNVLVLQGERPFVKLADFGISQELHGRGFARPDIVHHAIIAPEVAAAGYTSRQSDLYQVGLLLYWMVVGAPALDYGVPHAELLKQVNDGLPRARAEKLGTPIGHVIAKLLRRREAYRYASAREAWDDLRKLPEWTTRSG